MPTTHDIKTWVLVASVLLIFLFGIGIIILVVYIIVKLLQPATVCIYCDWETIPALPPMPYAPVAMAYVPVPAECYTPYPAPSGWSPTAGRRPCPYCHQPVPLYNRYCPSCGRCV